MIRLSLLVTLLLPGVASTVSAQAWADAYRDHKYEVAADLLHPIVADLARPDAEPDPEPFRVLTTLYARGLGVAADPIAACALAQLAQLAAHMLAPKYANDVGAYEAATKEGERFQQEHCVSLSMDEITAATYSMGCFAFGMLEQIVELGPHTVRIGRAGIALVDKADQQLPLVNCPRVIARVRTTSLQPPENAAPDVRARHFVEIFSWRGGGSERDDTIRYFLGWDVYEVRRGKLDLVAMENLQAVSAWPRAALTADLDARFHVEMIRSGHVRWRLDGTPPKRGWIMLPEEASR